MIVPKISFNIKISAETNSDNEPLYVLTVFINSIRGYDTVEGVYKGVFTEIPLELFLYKKYNTIPVTSETVEAVRSGYFTRLLDPDDINKLNFTYFGSEELTWGKEDSVRESVQGGTLMPSILESGTPISLSTCDNAVAPLMTSTSTGYYKSRVYISTFSSMEDLLTDRDLIITTIQAFVEKYIASVSTGELSGELYETEVITS